MVGNGISEPSTASLMAVAFPLDFFCSYGGSGTAVAPTRMSRGPEVLGSMVFGSMGYN